MIRLGQTHLRHARAGGLAALLGALLLLPAPPPAPAASLFPHEATGETNPCRVCHDTASGTPALRGWAGSGGGPTTGWGAKPLSALCYMCHQAGHSSGAHDMTAHAYADTSHGNATADLPREPDGSVQGSSWPAPPASGLPYTSGAELECTSCHDVHRPTSRPFGQRATVPALCEECHAGRGNDGAVRTVTGFTRSYSTHPTAFALGDRPRANLKGDAEIDADLRVATPAAPDYALGGHLAEGEPLTGSCQTCHAVHGQTSGSGGTPGLLAIDNTTATGDASALCEGCHYGGAAGEQVGNVAAYLQSALPAGAWSDHPIDNKTNRSFTPATAAIPANWTQAGTPNLDRGAQAFTSAGTPACSSCHDTHGGIADTPLLRGPQPVGLWGAFSYEDWCFACHAAAQLLPVAHHSTRANLAVALGDAIDSQLDCGDCHGPAGQSDWGAHNGFWAWAASVADTDSALCEACHLRDDPADLVSPALKGQTFTEPASFPAGHGTARGTGSHYLGPDSEEFPGVTPRVAAWTTSAYFSSYGPPNTGGGGSVAPVAAGEIICESCHNVLFNDGRTNPAAYGDGDQIRAGWRANLLLERYEDDSPGLGDGSGPYGVGTALCTGCHTQPGTHHPETGDVVSLSGLALRNGAGSYAPSPPAPGDLSYPGLDALDCDSCHRPHSADDDSDVAAAGHGAATSTDGRETRHILEIDGPAHRYSDLCGECHQR